MKNTHKEDLYGDIRPITLATAFRRIHGDIGGTLNVERDAFRPAIAQFVWGYVAHYEERRPVEERVDDVEALIDDVYRLLAEDIVRTVRAIFIGDRERAARNEESWFERPAVPNENWVQRLAGRVWRALQRRRASVLIAIAAATLLIAGTLAPPTAAPAGSHAASDAPIANSPAAREYLPAEEVRMTAAELFATDYAPSRLPRLQLRADAAGTGCNVLVIAIANAQLTDEEVEALHYGIGAYRDGDGGVQHFYRQRSFRGVAYRDAANHVFTFGDVSTAEVATLTACR